MTTPRNLPALLATGRDLLDHFDGPSLSIHWKEHDVYDGGTPAPDTCDHCYVAPMLVEIHEAWQSGSNETCEILWGLSDGYGEPGYEPEQGYDWSGIRDSTPAAVHEMWQAIHA